MFKIVDALPMTATGKVLKTELRERARCATQGCINRASGWAGLDVGDHIDGSAGRCGERYLSRQANALGGDTTEIAKYYRRTRAGLPS